MGIMMTVQWWKWGFNTNRMQPMRPLEVPMFAGAFKNSLSLWSIMVKLIKMQYFKEIQNTIGGGMSIFSSSKILVRTIFTNFLWDFVDIVADIPVLKRAAPNQWMLKRSSQATSVHHPHCRAPANIDLKSALNAGRVEWKWERSSENEKGWVKMREVEWKTWLNVELNWIFHLRIVVKHQYGVLVPPFHIIHWQTFLISMLVLPFDADGVPLTRDDLKNKWWW